jgi:ribosomal protein S18 acetylase RimI-like enzyme
METPVVQQHISVRSAHEADRNKLVNLMHFSSYMHRHLDWRPPLEWLGVEPFLMIERDDQIVAALACPPDLPEVAWVRLFVVSPKISISDAWEYLWPNALHLLGGSPRIAALPLQNWFRKTLEASNFSRTNEVVLLKWDDQGQKLIGAQLSSAISIRSMNQNDLNAVYALDLEAFDSIWRHSLDAITRAFQVSALATVAEHHRDGIVAYQISTTTHNEGHLARLAVRPCVQRKGVGYALLRDLLMYFRKHGISNVTVNTQLDNRASLMLYEKAGFGQTGEAYPVYQA